MTYLEIVANLCESLEVSGDNLACSADTSDYQLIEVYCLVVAVEDWSCACVFDMNESIKVSND